MQWHRLVFFVGGFDPKSPRHYHRLYRSAAKHRRSGSALESVRVGPLHQASAIEQYWVVNWSDGDASYDTRMSVLAWDDIVRQHWHRTLWRALACYWRVYVLGLFEGVLRRIWPVAKDTWLLCMFPLLLCLAVALLSALGAVLAASLFPSGAAAIGALAPLVWLAVWRALETRLDSAWLIRLYGFSQ
ncbi:MAG: hypothetical protein U5L74_12765, partial [Ideonella sp.]|nr:hypothetical protein [Ideonella sp.]